LMQLLEQHSPGPRLVPSSEALHGPQAPVVTEDDISEPRASASGG
jgi:hypothetical protein